MVHRRTYLASVGTALTAATAGCGFILGNEPAEFSASASAVADATLSETGYEFVENEENEIEREVSAGGETRTVIATNVQAKHDKQVGIEGLGEARAATFTSLTTPQVEVLGEEFNPVEDMSAADLAERGTDNYDGIENVQQQGESDVTINGTTTTQAKFTADAAFDGSPVQVYIHVSEAVELGSDFVVTFGVYPQSIDEEDNVLALMEAVESA